jgi:signal transduction histidine kinase
VALAFGVLYFLVGATAQTVIYQGFSVSALVAIVVGIRRYRPARQRPWWLFGAGLALWCAGDAYWDCYRWILQAQAPYPSFADLAYWLAYPLLTAGVFTLARGSGRPKLGNLLAGLIVTVAAAILTQLILLEPILGADSASWLGTLTAVGAPVADILLLAGLAHLVFSRSLENFSLRCMAIAIVATLVADMVYGWLNLKGLYTTGMAVDAGWLLFYGMWGVAALHPSMARLDALPKDESAELSYGRIALLTAALVTAPIALIGEAALGKPIDAYSLGGVAIFTTLLVGLRVMLLQRDRRSVQKALVISERSHRVLFEEAETARADLASQNEKLRELDAVKDDLIALVAHELRTPLTSIVGYLELLQDDAADFKEQHRDHLEVVHRNAHRLLDLVADLLFTAQVRAGRVTLEKNVVSIGDLLDQALAASAPIAAERNIEMVVEGSTQAAVIGDEKRLAQVVDNLLSNALKFTKPGGSVTVTVKTLGDRVAIEIKDSGIGISAADQTKLFSRFFRTETAMQNAIQGTGLGLSIVKAIVEGHGGEITVDSIEGEGATFRVVLPLAASISSVPVKEAA